MLSKAKIAAALKAADANGVMAELPPSTYQVEGIYLGAVRTITAAGDPAVKLLVLGDDEIERGFTVSDKVAWRIPAEIRSGEARGSWVRLRYHEGMAQFVIGDGEFTDVDGDLVK